VNQLSFLALVIVVMVLAGALGGLVNYLLQRKEEPESSNFWRSLALGWAAAFLVPLFLNMIASSLMSDIRTEPSKALVFLGFCLVAAISSTAFIKTLSERVLQEAREAKKVAGAADKKVVEVAKKVSEMEPEVERVVDRLTEPEPLSAVAAQASLPVQGPMGFPNSDGPVQGIRNGSTGGGARVGGTQEPEIGRLENDHTQGGRSEAEMVHH